MISHEHRCVFVHIPKCAGLTVEGLFVRDLGMTWEERAPLLLRPRTPGETAPPRLSHLPAADYVTGHYISRSLWDQYHTFAVIRDPWDRAVSLYRYTRFERVMSFENFVRGFLPDRVSNPDAGMHWFLRQQADFVLDYTGTPLVKELIPLTRLDEVMLRYAREGVFREGFSEVPHVNPAQTRRLTQGLLKTRAIYAFRYRQLRLASGWEAHWTPRLRASLAETYSRDVELWEAT